MNNKNKLFDKTFAVLYKRSVALLLGLFFSSMIMAQTVFVSGVINTYHKVVEIIPAKACVRITNIGPLDLNSRVMIIQMKGASILTGAGSTWGDTTSLGSAGNYEIGTVCHMSGDSVFLFHNLLNSYNTTLGKVQLVQFAEYNSVNIWDTVKAASWDSVAGTGGVIAIYADQDVTLTKPIYADSAGYSGGNFFLHSSNCIGGATGYVYNGSTTGGFTTGGAYKGEGVANLTAAQTGGRGAPANGGGGGNNHNNSGGGGANLTIGGKGGGNSSGSGCTTTARGEAGKAMSSWNGTKIFMGGGGGMGHNDNGIYTLGGGNGAGIIFIWANNINGNGQLITASGGNGGQSQSDGAGGGGAGGTIILNVNNYTGSTIVRANGGDGGNSNDAGNPNYCFGGGGGGSGGVIYFTGTIPSITTSVTGGLAGVESGRVDATCAAAQPALAGTDGLSFSNYTFQRSTDPAGYCQALLPVDLVSFQVSLINKKVLLEWEIDNPVTVAGFAIERSLIPNEWVEIKTIAGNDLVHRYTSIDNNPPPGKIYYRIKFLERNNAISYSPVRQIISGRNNEFMVYPNPASNKIIITGNYHYPSELQLVDPAGAIVFKQQVLSSPSEISLPSLPAGLYLLRFNHSVQKLLIR